ncbi:MAG TPA: glycosyltransferase [Lentisphaeria bacterium]|nr:MAG: glycosyl transferase family 2 [Lentisphaerae bacterium GWF2_50_93]HCE42143.1 glycosyltransferase [Lentisphaeria bacterium]
MSTDIRLSVVAPFFNESGSIPSLHGEIKRVCEQNGYTYEIIFVDDGSTDNTEETVLRLAPLKYIQFRKNFGQTAAMDAGIKAARYDLIVTMDGDGQNDPADIPAMIAYLQENNLDLVTGWRKNRKDSFSKRLLSRFANFLRHMFINDSVHDSGCSLKVCRRECFDTVTLYGEMHRFIPAILQIKGFKIGEIPVNHRYRSAGRTKYGFGRTVRGFIDLISVWFWNKYAVRPLHLLGGMGLFCFFLSSLSSAYTAFYYLRGGDLSNTVWPLLSTFLLLTGLQMFISGLIADMLSKNYYGTTRDTTYSIRRIREL